MVVVVVVAAARVSKDLRSLTGIRLVERNHSPIFICFILVNGPEHI